MNARHTCEKTMRLHANLQTFALRGPDRLAFPRNNERVLDCFLLEAEHFRKAHAGQDLDREDLLHGRLELQSADDLAVAQVYHRHSALEFIQPLGNGQAPEGVGLANLG